MWSSPHDRLSDWAGFFSSRSRGVRTLILIMSRGGGVSAVKFKPNMPKVASGDVRFTPLLENAEIAQTRLAHAIGRHDTVNRRCVVAELIFHHVPLWPGTTGRPRNFLAGAGRSTRNLSTAKSGPLSIQHGVQCFLHPAKNHFDNCATRTRLRGCLNGK